MIRTLAPLIVVTLSVAGILAAGHAAEGRLHQRERYALAFADISCEPPPGMERGPFLDEVQYLASQPDQLCQLDRDLAERLAEAFAQHPWVEKVQRIDVLPGRRVKVSLVYRTPVLAVRFGAQVRATDANGILLPPSAATEGLPVFQGTAPPPAGPAGTLWGDAAVEAAARSALVAPGHEKPGFSKKPGFSTTGHEKPGFSKKPGFFTTNDIASARSYGLTRAR